MEHIDIQLFLLIAKEGSISKAADIMHFSQSTVSYRLKLLEKEVGVQLFSRNKGKRTVDLTYHGEQFIPVAEQWLSVYRNTQDLKYVNTNMLTIGAIGSISSSLLANVYHELSEGPSPIQLNILTRSSFEIYELIENQVADVGIVAFPRQRKNIVISPIFDQKIYIVRYSKRPTAPRKIPPEELRPEFEIYMRWGDEYDQWHKKVIGSCSLYHVSVDSIMLLQQFLINEDYWALVPDNTLQQLLSSFHNIQIDELDVTQEFTRRCYVIKNRYTRVSRQYGLEAFEEALKKHFIEFRGMSVE